MSQAPDSQIVDNQGTQPGAIAPLPNLPLFHKIAGRKVVVAGSSHGARWKAELVAAAGAEVLVLAGHEAAAKLFDGLNAASIRVEPREWTAADLDGTVLAIGDIGDPERQAAFITAAQAAGALINFIDRTDLCDVQFGTIVNRSPIVLAISTDGAAPMLGQSIRTRIESLLPLSLSGWAKAAADWRPRLKAAVTRFDARREFWTRFVGAAWANVDRSPSDADFDRLLAGSIAAPRGSVTLVGAGPGDPELLTLKAVRALQSATVILYDRLVGPEILELARREAKRISVGKAGHGPSCSQKDISRRIVDLARAGEKVVRLKGGDPLVFGRATEELDACRAAGIDVSIIPGITAAQGAAASLGFSLTEREKARRIQFVTGHGADGKLPADIDWTAIADAGATTVVYMPRATLGEFGRRAIAAGLDPATPAIAIASATLAGEAHVRATLANISVEAASLPAGAPVLVIIGNVARERLSALVELAA